MSRDDLADTLWPRQLPASWDSRLPNLVSRVRTILNSALPDGAEPLVACGGVYRMELPGDVRVDVQIGTDEINAAHGALERRDLGQARDLATAGTSRLALPCCPVRRVPGSPPCATR